MIIDTENNAVAYQFVKLQMVEADLNEIEKLALADGVDGDSARSIISSLNSIRDVLHFKRGVQRHPKFAGEFDD